MIEHKIQSEKGHHHNDITDNAEAIANFVNHIEPFVYESRCCAGNRFHCRFAHYNAIDAREYEPNYNKSPPLISDADHNRYYP